MKSTIPKRSGFLTAVGVGLVLLAWCAFGADAGSTASGGKAAELSPSSNGVVSPKDEADALHLVIAADREQYCRAYVAQQKSGGASYTAGFREKPEDAWPVPAEMFRRAAESIQSQGAEFSYALRSLNPINPRNGPQTDLERKGLEFIAGHPDQAYYGPEMLGGRRYFTGVYPDLPAVRSCIDCHAGKSGSKPYPYHVGEPMGAVVVRVPLEF
jgi:hypothetical protein